MIVKEEKNIKLYLIGGLGADERVFRNLSFEFPVQAISWIPPRKKEVISDYVKRLSTQIDTEADFGILGVSYGGLIAIELSKFLNPKFLVLISSVETYQQLPSKLIILAKLGLLKLIPNRFIKPPKFLRYYLFGAKDKNILNEIIDDTDPKFLRWALATMMSWKNDSIEVKTIRIHGENDKLIPLRGEAIKMKEAGHFMVVDNAMELSRLINSEIDKVVNN